MRGEAVKTTPAPKGPNLKPPGLAQIQKRETMQSHRGAGRNKLDVGAVSNDFASEIYYLLRRDEDPLEEVPVLYLADDTGSVHAIQLQNILEQLEVSPVTSAFEKINYFPYRKNVLRSNGIFATLASLKEELIIKARQPLKACTYK